MKHLKTLAIQPVRADGVTEAHADFALALVDLYIEVAAQVKKEDQGL